MANLFGVSNGVKLLVLSRRKQSLCSDLTGRMSAPQVVEPVRRRILDDVGTLRIKAIA